MNVLTNHLPQRIIPTGQRRNSRRRRGTDANDSHSIELLSFHDRIRTLSGTEHRIANRSAIDRRLC